MNHKFPLESTSPYSFRVRAINQKFHKDGSRLSLAPPLNSVTFACDLAREKPIMQSTVAVIFAFMLALTFAKASEPQADEYYNQVLAKFLATKDQARFNGYRTIKRSPHNIDTRALNQFKNCYFSPIQCVLMERRR
ncbi:unnamed protein product [Auanema sp. JU1783]|nr:unnamed protein product [Auanema sp. JU1783]